LSVEPKEETSSQQLQQGKDVDNDNDNDQRQVLLTNKFVVDDIIFQEMRNLSAKLDALTSPYIVTILNDLCNDG
jgi:hypothetical protein